MIAIYIVKDYMPSILITKIARGEIRYYIVKAY